MDLTHFIAQILGPLALMISASLLFRKKMMMEVMRELVEDRALLYVLGVLDFVFGLILVLVHNIWNGDTLTLLVTVTGWLLLFKGIVRMIISPAALKKWYKMNTGKNIMPLLGLLTLLIGVYFTYAGFGMM
jgi:uncharacterized membrane protein HdeD (DUF308 family)